MDQKKFDSMKQFLHMIMSVSVASSKEHGVPSDAVDLIMNDFIAFCALAADGFEAAQGKAASVEG